MQRAVLERGLNLGHLLSSTGGHGSLVELRDVHRAVGIAMAPVLGNLGAVDHALDGVGHIGAPVAGSGGQGLGGSGGDHGDVVAHDRHAGSLTGGGGAYGIGMLGNEHAAIGDQGLGGLLFQSHVGPAVGVAHLHGRGGAHAAGAQEEAGVAGDNLSEGERAHIADLGGLGGDGAVLDHLIELHAGHNAADIAGLIDGGEVVVDVGQPAGAGGGAGRVAELNVGIFGSGLEHIAFLAKAGGEDDVAAVFGQVNRGFVSGFGLGNVVLDHHLVVADAQGFLRGLEAIDVVGGIAFVFVTDADVAHLDFFRGDRGARCGYTQNQAQRQQHAYQLLHCVPSSCNRHKNLRDLLMIHQLWRFVKKKGEHFFIKIFMRSEIVEFSQQMLPFRRSFK